jgi:hypothetical protein
MFFLNSGKNFSMNSVAAGHEGDIVGPIELFSNLLKTSCASATIDNPVKNARLKTFSNPKLFTYSSEISLRLPGAYQNSSGSANLATSSATNS